MRRFIAVLIIAVLGLSAALAQAEDFPADLELEEVELEEESAEETDGTESAEEGAPEEAAQPAGDHLPVGLWPEPSGITPAYRSTETPAEAHEHCFWCTPMSLEDEEAIWKMLTSPVTVVQAKDREKPLDDQMRQTVLYAEPDEKSEKTGMVTGQSQGVHVLETRDDGWSKVETYSTSFHDSKVKNWNGFVTGYIRTEKLKTVEVNQNYGVIIDKLTQRLYLFVDGHLFTTLAVSTGLYNRRQPYNETRSGEYLLIYYRKGDLPDGTMHCYYPIRFNGGDYLHEVPCVVPAGGNRKDANYKQYESKLGSRASHGCIRVQRGNNAEGYNMFWLFNLLNSREDERCPKMVIWEDYEGRRVQVPDDGTPLYYNPNGGSMYHSLANCKDVKQKFLPLTAFTYGQLDEKPYSKLKRCPYCQPLPRKETIEKINEEHLDSSPGEVMSYHKK